MSDTINFKDIAGEFGNLKLLKEIHEKILGLSNNIQFKVFPIYIRYSSGDKNVALLYFKGKSGAVGEAELGLNIGLAKPPVGTSNGKHMKYPGINCSIKLNKNAKFTASVNSLIKLISF